MAELDDKNNDACLSAALYLIPSTMSDAPAVDVMPARNIAVMSQIRHFVVEDVRTARRFLKACNRDINIDELTFSVLNVKTDPKEIPAMLLPLAEGKPIGLISEAGCPAVADPGALLVDEAHRRGFDVIPLVGPSSIMLALMASGFNGQSFTFNGYLPIDRDQRSATLRKHYSIAQRDDITQIYIETPYRNNRLIQEILAVLPPSARLCVASDLTGSRQRIISAPLSQWRKIEFDFDKIPAIFLIYK